MMTEHRIYYIFSVLIVRQYPAWRSVCQWQSETGTSVQRLRSHRARRLCKAVVNAAFD